jgi:hypothetical protein
MGTEAFAQVAGLFAPGYTVTAVQDERFDSPFKFYRMEAQTLYLSASLHPLDDGLTSRTTLRSMRTLATGETQSKVHFSAAVRLSPQPLGKPAVKFSVPAAGAMPIDAATIYRVYFHSPAYQVLERVGVEAERAVGLMATPLPPNTDPANAASLMAPRLIELCFQTAGIWEMKNRGRMALPLGIESVTTYRQPEDAKKRRLYALVEAVEDGAKFNARVVDDKGAVYVEMTGYRTVALPVQVTLV